jgi:signal transduction histidine kinase
MEANSNNHKAQVLVVDDITTNLGVLFDYLKNFGYRVLVAQSGPAALELLEDTLPDIILLDILMPEMDGFETCRRLKENKRTKDIPVIFMTAVTETVDKVKGFELGAVDYITKPIQHEEVLARVKTHLMLQSLQKNLRKKNQELEELNHSLEELVKEKTRQLVMQEKSAFIGRMIQGIIHNLKTPLAVIQNSNSVIVARLRKVFEDNGLAPLKENDANALLSIQRDCELIDKAYTQIMDMVNTLMLKSRMDHQEKIKQIDINELLRQELDFFKANPQYKHKTQKEIQLDENLPQLKLIYTNISQVVENLVNNALDAMWEQETQKLVIRSRQDQKNVYIDIQDTGMGIPPDKIETIFDPFFTTKPAKGEEKKGEPAGTGLGLHTCLELLKPFGGEIRVQSELGKGSTFTVVLPKQ